MGISRLHVTGVDLGVAGELEETVGIALLDWLLFQQSVSSCLLWWGAPPQSMRRVQLSPVASALGEKPYLCTVPGCGKRFTEYSSLYKHHVVHTHCKPYTCSSCGKTYRQTSTLAMHKRSSHGELEATEESEQALYEQQQLEGEQPLPHQGVAKGREVTARAAAPLSDPIVCRGLPGLPTKSSSIGRSLLQVTGWEQAPARWRGKGPSCQAITGLVSSQSCALVVALEATGRSRGFHTLIMLLFPFSDPAAAAADRGSPLKSQHIAFLSEMEEDEEEDAVPAQVSLISQDGTEQVWTQRASSMSGTAVIV